MAIPIVEAKVTRPTTERFGALHPPARKRLEQLLEDVGVAVVSSPPGFGRRQVVAAWCEDQPPGTTAWLACDAADNGRRLLIHAAEALHRADPTLGVGVADRLAATDPDTGPTGDFHRLLAEVAALERPFTFVIDGIDRLPAHSLQGLFATVRDRPANGRIVLITTDESVLAAWPAGAELRPPSIGVELLRLGVADVARVVAAVGIDAGDDEIRRLHRDSGGWLAGVQLTAEASLPGGRLQRFDSTSPAISEFIHRVVCNHLDEDLREFLGDIAPAGRVDPDLARRVSGRRDAGALLRRLQDRNLLDQVGSSVVVPAPIRDHLEDERRHVAPIRLTTTRNAAARAHAAAGRADDALDIIERAPDDHGLVDLLLTSHHVWSAGPHARRISRIATKALGRDPHRIELYLVRAWAEALCGEVEAAEATLSLVVALPTDPIRTTLVRGEAAAVRTNLARIEGRMDDALVHARSMTAIAESMGDFPKGTYRGMVPDGAPLMLGVALLCAGELDECRQVLLAATTLTHWRPIALGSLHGALAIVAWLRDDPVASIHAAIAASHIDQRASQGDFLGPTALALTGEGAESDAAADWTDLASAELDSPLAGVLGAAVRAVRSDDAHRSSQALAEGRRWVERAPQPGVLPAIISRAASIAAVDDGAPDLGDALTDGELRVVRALRGDLTEREVAEELHLSHNTVRTYRRRAYRKLGVSSRADAIRALERPELP